MFDYQNILNSTELERYSRHIVLNEFDGPSGQIKLKGKKVCVVGAGGLGNIASSYLAALGFGSITIIDNDSIELNNLNRQILYNVKDVGSPKADTLASRLRLINSLIEINVRNIHLNYENSTENLQNYDIVLDCTDNPYSRYCINDTCRKLGIPVVFGSALRWAGQMSVFGYKDGPCMRCVFPVPIDPVFIGTCDDQGVIGPVVGVIGSLQAIEALKIALDLPDVVYKRFLLFDGLGCRQKVVQIRSKSLNCPTCDDLITLAQLAFPPSTCILEYSNIPEENMLSVESYKAMLDQNIPHTLVDVRVSAQYNSARFRHSIHIPLNDFLRLDLKQIIRRLNQSDNEKKLKIVCILCRRGQKSRNAVEHLVNLIKSSRQQTSFDKVYNITGGLKAWAEQVDSSFPYF